MKNKKTMTIDFPILIPGNKLGDKVHNWNSVRGGAKLLKDLGENQNSFLGGICAPMIGLIRDYGFYACPHYERRTEIIAFFAPDPNMVTDEGKRLIEERFPEYKIIYELHSEQPAQEMSPEKRKAKEDLLTELKGKGEDPKLYQNSTANELRGVLEALESGKGLKATQSIPEVEPTNDNPYVKHRATPMPQKARKTAVNS